MTKLKTILLAFGPLLAAQTPCVHAKTSETPWAFVSHQRPAKEIRQVLPKLHQQAYRHLQTLRARESDSVRQAHLDRALEDWSQSYCQITPGAQGRLHLQFFPRHLAKSKGFEAWRRSPLLLGGGGPSLWSLEYDLADQRFGQPRFHGSI